VTCLAEAAERGIIPDGLVRVGIRRMIDERRRAIDPGDPDERRAVLWRHVDAMATSPIAVRPDAANAQHYEVPAAFFESVLGPRLKYSACLWAKGVDDLAGAEEAMLALTCERAAIEDGMEVLDLGCGWGSLTLWLAERFPRCRVTAVSNSASQGRFIALRARERGFSNVRTITADVNDFEVDGRFDRIVSVEMLEHVRNYDAMLGRIARWLAPDGRFFAHVFCHRAFPYFYEPAHAGDWMARTFFTGGMMPSEELLGCFQRDLRLERSWRIGGMHYTRTLEAWLRNLDADAGRVRTVLAETHGDVEADRWVARWRLFFMACAELFGCRAGNEWFVAHYRFARQPG